MWKSGGLAPTFLTMALDESGYLHAPTSLIPEGVPLKNSIEGCVGPKAALDVVKKKKRKCILETCQE
jgi:hypothetical protein